jgi:hypothetical protein
VRYSLRVDTDPIEKRSDSGPIAVYFTLDEALVLLAFLERGQKAGNNYGTIEDQAELRVLWDLDAILESSLVAPLSPDYLAQLARARDAVRDFTD